jgi:FAD/FMN-containing dehydrogenase
MGGSAKRYEPWSRLPCGAAVSVIRPAWRSDPLDLGAAPYPVLPFGQGRTFGDTCANPGGIVIDTDKLDRFIDFDQESGLLGCESGVTVAQILELVVPRGWFLPVCPGTKHVSVGGAIAHDVHGKNHPRTGTFGEHVVRLELLRSSGERLSCGRDENTDLFRATIGGLGLTGLILSAQLRLERTALPILETESVRCTGLDEFFDFAEAEAHNYEYQVTWVDSFARGDPGSTMLIVRANTSGAGRMMDGRTPRRLRLPASIPTSFFNRLSIRALNVAYYRSHVRRITRRTEHYESFLFPQDDLHPTNRIYGRRGVWSYQALIPLAAARAAVPEMLRRVSRPGDQSWGTVLKVFGERTAPGLLSFTGAGISMTLGFPNRGARCLRVLGDLDRIVRDAGGKLYPAKDGRMPADAFKRSFPAWEEFARLVDPRFSSRFWRRVSEPARWTRS